MAQALEEEYQMIFERQPVMRSLPDKNLWGKASKKALYHILEYGYIEFYPENEGIKQCYERGWLHRTRDGQGGFLPSQPDICVFPSHLHEKY